MKVNQTFLAWSGYARDAIVGRRRFTDLLAAGDRIYYETHVAPMLRMQGRVREIALEIVLQDGSKLPVIANAVAKADTGDGGAPAVVRLAVFDATERRSYERELLAARRRAEASEARSAALARTLQASLLPPTVLQPPGLQLGATYRPSGDGSTVGGDFYDVFETASGRVAIVLGDVAGKGAEAAVLTSLARHVVRTEAMRHRRPAPVLATVAEAFLQYHPDDYCTAVLTLVEPSSAAATATATATVATGGHLLPMLWRSGRGVVERIGTPGQMLGVLEDPEIVETDVELAAGDVAVMFTDGVVEARRADGDLFGDDRLADVVRTTAAAGGSPQDVTDAVVAAALDFQDGDARDDIAVVAWRLHTVSGGPRRM